MSEVFFTAQRWLEELLKRSLASRRPAGWNESLIAAAPAARVSHRASEAARPMKRVSSAANASFSILRRAPAIAISYERRRPSERIFVDWIARCRTQLEQYWPSSTALNARRGRSTD
jgi:hypothetical protein